MDLIAGWIWQEWPPTPDLSASRMSPMGEWGTFFRLTHHRWATQSCAMRSARAVPKAAPGAVGSAST